MRKGRRWKVDPHSADPAFDVFLESGAKNPLPVRTSYRMLRKLKQDVK
jgi:hypothetical protein